MSVGVTEAVTFTCSGAGLRNTELSHDYMLLKRHCSFCLVGKQLSREATLAADKDADLCITLSFIPSHTAPLYNITALKTNAQPKAAFLLKGYGTGNKPKCNKPQNVIVTLTLKTIWVNFCHVRNFPGFSCSFMVRRQLSNTYLV